MPLLDERGDKYKLGKCFKIFCQHATKTNIVFYY